VFGALEIERFAVDWLRARMWDLRNNLTAYDAAYVALTEAVDADHLLTADAKMANAPSVNCSIALIS
jgi:predicted nucleic acid-binding protein